MESMILRIVFALTCISFVGCSTFNILDRTDRPFSSGPVAPEEILVEHGRQNAVLDGVGRFFGIPNQLAIGDRRIDNHDVSVETEMEIVNYLSANGLRDTMLRVNQYDPVGEWRRMVANPNIRPVWKATAGSYNLLKYTLLPGRVTGGDWYNPFSDTVNLYSDSPVIGVSKAAFAFDVRSRANPGAYAAVREIPLLGLQHDTEATRLTLDYYQNQRPEHVEQATATLYPNYGASWGSQLASFVPYGSVVGKIVGGLAGRVANHFR